MNICYTWEKCQKGSDYSLGVLHLTTLVSAFIYSNGVVSKNAMKDLWSTVKWELHCWCVQAPFSGICTNLCGVTSSWVPAMTFAVPLCLLNVDILSNINGDWEVFIWV